MVGLDVRRANAVESERVSPRPRVAPANPAMQFVLTAAR